MLITLLNFGNVFIQLQRRRVDLVLVVEVERLNPPRKTGLILQAGIGGPNKIILRLKHTISPLNFCRYLPAWVAALYLRDLDVPLSGGRSVREGEGQGGSVARRGADVDVDWKTVLLNAVITVVCRQCSLW